jgi:hypothetical protein
MRSKPAILILTWASLGCDCNQVLGDAAPVDARPVDAQLVCYPTAGDPARRGEQWPDPSWSWTTYSCVTEAVDAGCPTCRIEHIDESGTVYVDRFPGEDCCAFSACWSWFARCF